MRHFSLRPARLVQRFRTRLRWKLAASHSVVALATVALVMTIYVTIALLARGNAILSEPRAAYDPDFAQGTRLLAQLLPAYLPGTTADPARLELLLQELTRDAVPGSGPLGGTVNAGTSIVVVATDRNVLALVPGSGTSSRPRTLEDLEPPEWRAAFAAALNGERDLSTSGPLVRTAEGGRVLVSAYPIVDAQGTVVGAVGLRTQPLAVAGASSWTRLATLVVATGFALLELLVVAAIPATVVSVVASVLLTRRMTRQVQELESATEAIVQGDLGRRVPVVARDELGRLAERFNVLTVALERLETQRKRFFANIAHDLRTPLAVIRAQAEVLAQHPAGQAAPVRPGLERIIDEVEVLGRLVDDLFTLARLDERGLPLSLQPLEVRPLITAVLDAMRPLARRAGHIALATEVAPHCPPVRADPLRLRQVLVNLLHNALRHTPEGGAIQVTAHPEGDAVLFRVRDTGCGLPASLREDVFTRYHRTSDPASGAGLGLAVARQLVEAQGGQIWIESVPGEGTVVSFALPAATVADAALASTGERSS